MKTINRLTAFILTLFLVFSVVSIGVMAAETDTKQDLEQFLLGCYTLENEAAGSGFSSEPGYVNGEEVSVQSFSITVDILKDAVFKLHNSGKLPWYAGSTFAYTYDEATEEVLSFTPTYLDPSIYDRALYEQKIAEILAETVFEGMDQWQIALSIHDYLVTHSVYDESFTQFRGYDLLVNGTAVCSGYAEAYMDLLSRVGIESVMVDSQDMGDEGHGWNLVNIYGNWYHVDVTWDDPAPDVHGYVSHKYFLVTDEQIGSLDGGHFGWTTDIACTDTTYEDAFWTGLDSAISYASSQYSFYRETEPDSLTTYIICREEETGSITALYMDEALYLDLGDGTTAYYPHYGINLWNDRLYISSMDRVYSMNTDGTEPLLEYEHDVQTNGTCIYGSFVDDGILYLSFINPALEYFSQEVALDPAGYEPFHTHSYTSTTVDATCTENGYTDYTCSCGIAVRENYVLATGHVFNDGTVVKEPTTEETGLRQFRCLFCEESYTEDIPTLVDETVQNILGSVLGVGSLLLGPVILIRLIVRLIKKGKKRS